ncbi:MAG: NADPH-ferredoxin reductase FprA [Alphaproteobacteria bacterium MarineAlpha10_Bin2]|nr:MAG: NADPH-ferredoxin reductase FprA [Alphaproteobacteria bacterium MarineAlpha10_Bin2]
MSLSVAIIGSGPAAFYTADALVKSDNDCRIDIIERLPCPYGLIRFGVAPDHEKTKNVMRAFAKTAAHEDVNYYGNVEVGRDIGLNEIREMYDAVVLAVGAGSDRAVGIPGEDKKGVFGSATFVNWYNGHPDRRDLNPDLNVGAAVVLGNGNVAIDVARVLVKTPAEMAATDLPDYAAQPIQNAPLTDVYMVGRRGPNEAKYTNVELREMGHLENCVPQIDAAQLPESVEGEMSDRDRRLAKKNLATVREFVDRNADEKPKRVHFVYYAQPVEILGDDRVTGVRFERTEVRDGRAVGLGEFFEIPCGLVIAAIGYISRPVADTPFDERGGIVENDDGRVDTGLYAVGWIKRGPSGVIGTNKPDGKLAAEQIFTDHGAGGGKSGRAALEALLAERGVRAVNLSEWQTIEAAEIANAREGAPRKKFVSVAEMLAALG